MTIHGKLERYYGGIVRGWAADSEAAPGTSKVVLTVDGQPVAETHPYIERRDVERAGLPLLSGFQLSVPEGLRDGGVHEIALLMDGVLIPGGPQTVTLGRHHEVLLREAPLRDLQVVIPGERVPLRVDRMVGDPAQLHHFIPEDARGEDDPHYETDDIGVYELDDCLVLFPDGIIVSGDRLFGRTLYLTDRSRYRDILRSDGTLLVDEGSIETVAEPTFLFNCGSQNNFFHWHMDLLPKCLVLDQLQQPGMRVALPRPSLAFQADTVAQITERLAGAPPFTPRGVTLVRFRKLFYTPGLSGKALRPSPAIVRFFEGAALGDHADSLTSEAPKRIFLTRVGNQRRRLVNEEQVARALADRGFTVVNPSSLSVRAQRALFRECELVVGPHGAAFTNLLHANPRVGVVELFADRYVNVGLQRIANLKGLAYGFVIGPALGFDERRPVHDLSFEVDVDEVLQRVDDVARLAGHGALTRTPTPSPPAPPPSPQTRIVIHVGPGKTGSSALQQWLTTHHEALRAAGVLYPVHALDRNGVSSGNREELLDMVEVDGKTGHRVSSEKARALRATARNSGCHTLLLSSEFFFPAIVDIHQELPEAEFVVYVRDPIELLESNYNQSVKRHDETKAFTPPAVFRAGIFAQLQRLLTATPAPRLLVRPYGEGLFVGGDIVRDTLSVLGVTGVEPTPKRVNASYTLDALEFKRHANHFDLGPLQPIVDRTLQAYAVGQRSYSLVPPDTFAEMRGACVQQLDRLIDAYSLEQLRPLRDALVTSPQRPYVPQAVTSEQLFAVADHLEALEPETFAHLRARVQQAPGLPLPNPEFYARFA